MKKILLSVSVAVFFSVPSFCSADTLALWTFESSLPATAGPFSPESGSGSALGFHASGSAVYSNPAGNGSAESFSSTFWAVGDYWQFQTSTLGYSGVQLSWDQTSSSTGPIGFRLDYSTDGSVFNTFFTYVVRTNNAAVNNAGTGVATSGAWSSSVAQTGYSYAVDLSSITALDNQSSVYFRLVMDSAINAQGNTVPTGGTDRVDNFLVSAIPEPSSIAISAFSGVLLANYLRRRRS